MTDSKNPTTQPDGPHMDRAIMEQNLLAAAENVLALWSLIRAAGGKIESSGLSEAIKDLEAVCDAYPDV